MTGIIRQCEKEMQQLFQIPPKTKKQQQKEDRRRMYDRENY